MKLKILKSFFCLVLIIVVFKAEKALAFVVGETKAFNVDPSYDYVGRSTLNATLRQVGDKALFYVEDDWWQSLTNRESVAGVILNLLEEFDKTIYPRLTRVFGSEWSPGIDNEYRITVLIVRMKEGTGGYFNSADEYPKSQSSASNEREMIYVNGIYQDNNRTRVFLAHEFQHLINFYQKEKLRNLKEEIWLNEARSEYASTICGYDDIYSGSNLEKRVNEFLRNPSNSLTEWENKTEDYGPVNLFLQYLVSRYSERILTEMMRVEAVGMASINEALTKMGFSEKFSEVFTNWTIANFVNDCQLGDGQKFCYLSALLSYPRFHLSPSASSVLKAKEGEFVYFTDNVKDWTGRWYEISPLGLGFNLALSFSGVDGGNFQVPVLIYYADGRKSINYLKLINKEAAEIVKDFGDKVKSVVLIPSSQSKIADFSAREPAYSFFYRAEITSAGQISSQQTILSQPTPAPSIAATQQNPNYPDGSLIRAAGDYRIFVIKGKYKRWIQSPAILAAYPHLGWQSVIEVTPEERDWYQDSWLVRADGDYKVYEINGDLSKHWLNMSARQFSDSGRSWDSVFIINNKEKDLYKTGAEVLK